MGAPNEKNVDIKRIQALKWIGQKVDGMTTRAIAKEAGVSHDTVEARLSWAKRAGILTSYEDKLMVELIPAAHKAILEALQDGDAAVALEVYKGSFLLGGAKQPKQSSTKITQLDSSDDGEDLATYMRKLRNEAQQQENLIEGSVAGQVKRIEGNVEPLLLTAGGEHD